MSYEKDTVLLYKTQCPECRKQGKDNSKDNLAVYSDGHKFCYGCGFYSGVSNRHRLSEFSNSILTADVKHNKQSTVFLPSDSNTEYPQRAIDWVGHYELNKFDLLNNNVLWSETNQRLIFPIYGDSGVIAWQGRYFGQDSPDGKKYPKWYGKGDLKNTFNILGTDENNIYLVEDIISAIKLSRITKVMPLYGCSIGKIRFKRLRMLIEPFSTVWIWLDPDKRKESLLEARRGSLLGMNVRVKFSDKDPKEESYENLNKFLSLDK